MADNTADSVQHLEGHELFALLLQAVRLHAGREAPLGADVDFEIETANLNLAQLRTIAQAHATTCAGTTGTGLERLASAVAALATHIVFADLLDDADLRQLYVAVVTDQLAGRNHHFVDWGDADTFPPAIDQARASGNQGPLLNWYRAHLEPRPPVQLFAVIIGAMTDGEEIKIKAVRSRATAIKLVLERHGYSVHAPCAGPPSGREPAVVVQDDVDKIARADIVIALLDPAALGVGILLGEAARSHPAVIFVAEACTDITPLAAIIGDPDPTRVTYITDASMATEVERAIIRRRDVLHARAADRRLKATISMETFEEYSQAHRFALDSGLTLEVPNHPDYRVRLICTSIASFCAATQAELQDICVALNDLLYGPDEFKTPAAGRQPPAQATDAESDPKTEPVYKTAHDRPDDDYDDQDDEFVEEWDQPSLFQDFTRHTEASAGELPPGWRRVNPLITTELDFAEIANKFLELSEREFRRMVREARVVRYREALAGAGVSRAHFGDTKAWITFWKVNLGRP